MATITGIAALAGAGTLPKIRTSKDNTVPIYRLLKLNNKTITAHNRLFSIDVTYVFDDVLLLSGNMRRFLRASKQHFNLDFKYLPSDLYQTVDGQYGRDYLLSIAGSKAPVEVFIQDTPNDAGKTYTMFVESYTEDLVRRNLQTGCYFYNVTLKLKER